MNNNEFIVKPNTIINLKETETDYTGQYKSKKEAKEKLKLNIKKMQKLQATLYAANKYSVLLIFQAMDAAGKDSTIKHVMSGLNPQGTDVHSFKQPSSEELNHDYLWRNHKALPERGRIGIFNRSYYEEVLVVRVHNLIKNQRIPAQLVGDDIWKTRYNEINNFEKYLNDNGTIIIKFFLNVSKEEQKKRFLERIENESKNWKFSDADIKERGFWDDYRNCYQDVLSSTSKKNAPWYVIPADHKWFMRLAVSSIFVEHLENLNLKYPVLEKEELKRLEECRIKLENE